MITASKFAKHEIVNEKLKCKSFFAQPYHAYERGSNEYINGLIRQYFPKKKPNMENLNETYLQFMQDEINNRPWKNLNWKTPNELMAKYLNKKKKHK